jgi:preprotein translocase subunit SecG
MTTFLSYLFSFLLIVDSLLLGLLVLVQLPKKEAGIGMAFGGGAADALFGAGSGNALTKLTKYSAIFFFILVLGLCMIENSSRSSTNPAFERALEQRPPQTRQPAAPAAAIPTNASAAPALMSTSNAAPAPKLSVTNLPAPAK